MLTIRLARVGKNKKAQFKIVLQEKTIAPGGRHVEILGSYDPHSKQALIKEERAKYWISKGAQVSDTAYNLFVSKGLISDKKRPVKLPAKKVEEVPVENNENKTENQEAPVVESKPEEVKPEETKTEEAPKEEVKA